MTEAQRNAVVAVPFIDDLVASTGNSCEDDQGVCHTDPVLRALSFYKPSVSKENELVCDDTDLITIRWEIADVQRFRPDLSDEQAMQVLLLAYRKLDSSVGLNWTVLEIHAASLFPGHPWVDSEDDDWDDLEDDDDEPSD